MERKLLRHGLTDSPMARFIPEKSIVASLLLMLVMAGVLITGPAWAADAADDTAARNSALSPAAPKSDKVPDEASNKAADMMPDEEAEADDDALMLDLLNETGSEKTAPPAAAKAQSSPFHYEGELTGSVWAVTDDEDDWRTDDRLDIKAWGDIGAVSLNSRFRLSYHDLDQDEAVRADFRELYATYQVRPTAERYADIAIGRKILYWGKGDEVRPLDRINPEDQTTLYFDDLNERKTGRTGVFADLQLNKKIRVEGFWTPYFEAGRTPEPGDYFAPAALNRIAAAGIAIDDADEPDQWAPDSGAGGRIMFSLFKTDMAVYAFQGYDPNVTYVVNRIGPDPTYGLPIVPRSIRAVHPRMTLYGLDMERAIGSVVLRAEAAYQTAGALFNLNWADDPTLLLEAPDGVVEKEQVQYMVGLDKYDLLIHNLFVNLQFIGGHIFDHDPDMSADENRTGITAYARYSWMDSKLELWYRYMQLFEDNDRRHHAQLSYKPLPWMQTSLGAVAFSGDADSAYFGQFADRDYFYAKMKLVF